MPHMYIFYRSVIPRNSQTYRLKVRKARLDKQGKRVSFDKVGNVVYVEIRESSANIVFILKEVKSKCGSDYIVVTADGLEVKDSSGSRGKFHTCTFPKFC